MKNGARASLYLCGICIHLGKTGVRSAGGRLRRFARGDARPRAEPDRGRPAGDDDRGVPVLRAQLWRDSTERAWVVVALMNLAMIALHLPAPAHHHGAVSAAAPSPSTLMTVATLVALVEVTAAAAALYVRSRGRIVALRAAAHQPPTPSMQYSFLVDTPDQR